jgi:glycosyltransferase involved in cell wall biosynthesis
VRILYIEPWDAGSHAAFTRTLTRGVEAEWTVLTLPGRHWKWRMRGSAVWFADAITQEHDLLFASAHLPLADLVALAPQLAAIPRVLYFHENQLAYPVRGELQERDHHFGFTQLVSALVATVCVFNSAWNRDSFLDAGERLLRRMPDAVPRDWIPRIRERSRVLPVPLALPDVAPEPSINAVPLVLWNHRWEHDKDPDAFFRALDRVDAPFRLAVCGERFRDAPPVFERARARFADRIDHWGYADSREAYEALLRRADLVVSTAVHEFFGISILEAVHFGARPLVPDRLAYVEWIPSEYRYTDEADLAARVDALLRTPEVLRADRRDITRPYLAAQVLPSYAALFDELR